MRKIITSLAAIIVVVFGMYACDIPGMNANNNDGAGPEITSQPRDTSVELGEIASFTITAKDAISYKWVHNNTDTVYSGAPILAFLNGVEASDTGAYKCIVGNVSGATTVSNTVHLHVGSSSTGTNPPVITSQPHDITVSAGGTATFTVTASGAVPLSYQWMKGSSNLTGKTSASLVLANVSSADTGNYKCKVTNSLGSVTSTTAHLGLGGGNSSGLLEFDMSVLNSLNPTSGTMITREIEYYCDTTGATLADTTIDTSFYAVTGGKLYTWDDPKACYADQMSGTSTTVIGTWTAIEGMQVQIPAAYKPAGCTGLQDSSYDDFGGLFENATVIYTVSATKVHAKISGDVCFAELFSDSFVDTGNGITASNLSCASVDLTNSSNHTTATITSTFSNNTLGLQFKSGSSTCTISEPIPVPGVLPNCSQAQDTTFFTCLDNSPFFQTALAKKSAGSRALQQRFHKSFSMKRKGF